MNLFLEVFQHAHWFIEPDSLNLLLNTLKSENAKDSFEENFKTFFKNPEDDKAISYEVVDGVASIPLYGPIFPKSNFMTWLGYATALTDLKNAFEKAKMDTLVDSVALICHSPGGVVFGVNAFSQYLKNYEKKVSTYVPGMCCSAAYWIASASDEIIVDETAMVGSIGVVCDVLNPEHDPYIEITNRKSPNKRPNPATEEGKGVIQDELDALADVFINAVAGNRNVSISVVENKFGKGGVLVGKDAVSAGMVDSIATFDEFASSLKKDKEASFVIDKKTNEENNMNLEELQAAHPKLWEEIQSKFAKEEKTPDAPAEKSADTEALEKINTNISKIGAVIKSLDEKIKTLEKKDAVRDEKDAEEKASLLADSVLAGTKLSPVIKGKIKKSVNYADHVSEEGVFDSEAFKAAVETEAEDYKKVLSGKMEVAGASSNEDFDNVEGMKDEDINSLLSDLGIVEEAKE